MSSATGRARLPEFLEPNDNATHKVRCPIHGFISFSENERAVIDHPLFRRLRHIRQLALTEYLYPGANHTRFEHSLGVMDVATRAFDHLAIQHGEWMENTFRQVEGMQSHAMALARQYLRLAALLHDVGHSAFSHAAEGIVHQTGHEQLSLSVVRETGLMGSLLSERYGADCPERVAQLIEGGRSMPPQLRLLHDIVSGQMDADRTDYLLRDSYHCGVDYGRFDHRRMIQCFDLCADLEFGWPEIALHKDGIHTLEALILARYQMNTQVYYHRVRRIYDLYLIRYHQALAEEQSFSQDEILRNNDVTMMARIMLDANDIATEKGKWAARIVSRDHHRLIFETGVNATAIEARLCRLLEKDLAARYNRELLFDHASANIHKLLRDDPKENGLVALRLTGQGVTPRYVGRESQVLSTIPREFQCFRLFGNFSRSERSERDAMRDDARSTWRGLGGN